jgi:hypothetical protein
MSNYAVFRFYAPYPPTSVLVTPVGVVLWDTKTKEVSVKFITHDTSLETLTTDNVELVSLVKENIDHFIKNGLPCPDGDLKPFEYDFWVCIRNRLIHSIRLSKPEITITKVSDIDNFFEQIIYKIEGYL